MYSSLVEIMRNPESHAIGKRTFEKMVSYIDNAVEIKNKSSNKIQLKNSYPYLIIAYPYGIKSTIYVGKGSTCKTPSNDHFAQRHKHHISYAIQAFMEYVNSYSFIILKGGKLCSSTSENFFFEFVQK
jgi:hypothetical protein